MNPVPLTDPSGTIRAWMCGHCYYAARCVEWASCAPADADDVQMSRNRAASCCACRKCGAASRRWRLCDACEASVAAAREAWEAAHICVCSQPWRACYGECVESDESEQGSP